jgi:hypothetical protein
LNRDIKQSTYTLGASLHQACRYFTHNFHIANFIFVFSSVISTHREFDNSLGHAGADAEILNAFKRGAHEHINIGRTAPGTVYKAGPDGKRFRTAMNENAHEKISAASSITNDVSFNNNVPVSCASNNHVTMHSSTKDMTKDMTTKHLSMMICDCVKTVLFRRLKFYNKLLHGLYNFRTGSGMARVIQFCNVEQDLVTLQWWKPINKLIGNTLTDHRNNVSKTIHHCFEGKCKIATCS